ncbi:glycoside hydrolase family protein [Micromonospora sp. NPDC002575]|uniref:glycoside hydrolase family protein n=1 Tax=Micromonospora sp. NPDC002575 TaxID=3364222 RepID=UPI003688BFAE
MVLLLVGVSVMFVAAVVVGPDPATADGPQRPPTRPTEPSAGPCPIGKAPRDMEISEFKDFVAKHESPRGLAGDPHVYVDTKGHPTVGIGFNLDRADARARLAAVGANYDDVRAGRVDLTQVQITILFEQTIAEATSDAYTLLVNFDQLSTARQAVVIDMIFNLGRAGVAQFHNMLAALDRGDYETAASEMENSAWKQQTGTRASQDVTLMRRGMMCDPLPPGVVPVIPPVSSDIPGYAHHGGTGYPGGVTTFQPSNGTGTADGGTGVLRCNFKKIDVFYNDHWITVLDIYC